MAIIWGSPVTHASPATARVGLEMSVSYPGGSLDATDTQATVSWELWIQVNGGFGNGNDSWTITGDDSASGVTSWIINTSGGTYKMAQGSEVVSLIYGQSQTFTLTGQVFDVGPSTNDPKVTRSVTVGARPLSRPAAPSSFSASRVNDSQISSSWTRNSSTAAPYTNQEVWRSTDGGAFVNIATISGTATSYTDTSVVANRRYTYKVRATNSAGSSNFSGTDDVSTTPSAPSSPEVTKNSAGDIIVSRPTLSSVATHWELWHAADGVWDAAPLRGTGGTLGGLLTSGTATFTHPTPNPTETHAYRVKAVSSDPVLYSVYSPPSQTVQLLTPPGRPTGLSPNGIARQPSVAFNLGWLHVALDATPQTAYEVQYRLVGASVWSTTGKVTSTSSLRSVSWAAGLWEWRVRTWGQHADPSDWSAVATVPVATLPVVGAVSPSGTITQPSALFQFTFFQAEGAIQTQWEMRITEGLSGGGALVRTAAGTDQTQWQSPAVLVNGADYTWTVRVRDSNGQWSVWDAETFSVAFVPPNPPTVGLSWRDEGYVLIDVEAVGGGGAPDTEHVTIERSIDGGPWEVLAENLPPTSEYLDWTASASGVNAYRVTAYSDLGAAAATVETIETGSTCGVWIGGGQSFARTAFLPVWTERDFTGGRERTLHHFDGQTSPTEVSGPAVPHAFSISGMLSDIKVCSGGGPVVTGDRDALTGIFDLPGPHLYRDDDGRYIWVSLSDLTFSDTWPANFSFTVTRAQPATVDALDSIWSTQPPFIAQVRPGEFTIYGGSTLNPGPGEWGWEP